MGLRDASASKNGSKAIAISALLSTFWISWFADFLPRPANFQPSRAGKCSTLHIPDLNFLTLIQGAFLGEVAQLDLSQGDTGSCNPPITIPARSVNSILSSWLEILQVGRTSFSPGREVPISKSVLQSFVLHKCKPAQTFSANLLNTRYKQTANTMPNMYNHRQLQ